MGRIGGGGYSCVMNLWNLLNYTYKHDADEVYEGSIESIFFYMDGNVIEAGI